MGRMGEMGTMASRLAAYASVALIASLLCFWGLGDNDLANVDEIIHVHVARRMVAFGEWWSPTGEIEPYFKKPLPALWLMAAGFGALGVTPFSSRMWAALFAVATVLVLQRLAEKLYGTFAGWVAGMALATSYTFIYV